MNTDLIVHLSLADEILLDSVGPNERAVLLETFACEQAFANAESELSRSRRRNEIIQGDIIA
jgi:hypothetical protein